MTRPLPSARALGLALGLGLLLLVSGPAHASAKTEAAAFSGFQTAWAGRSPTQVVNLLDPKGRLRVRVLAPRIVDASWTRAQAKKGLGAYFGKRGVSGLVLKDVTPARSGRRTVRLFDYTYRPHGKDVRTTRLTVTVKQDARKRWVLASVIESVRPTPRRLR